MSKPFKILRDKMSPERLARVEKQVDKTLRDMDRHDAYVEGAKAAADIAATYNSTTTHPYRLDDCILSKMNLTKKKPRKNKDAPKVNRYLFLIAFLQGSDMANGEKTRINQTSDLLPQHRKGNRSVFAVEVHCVSKDVAYAYGIEQAFFTDYTDADSVFTIVELNKKDKITPPNKIIKVS